MTAVAPTLRTPFLATPRGARALSRGSARAPARSRHRGHVAALRLRFWVVGLKRHRRGRRDRRAGGETRGEGISEGISEGVGGGAWARRGRGGCGDGG